MSKKTQAIILVCCGTIVTLFVGIGMVFIARFIPPHSPSASALEIATIYKESVVAIKTGLVFCLFGVGFCFPLIAYL